MDQLLQPGNEEIPKPQKLGFWQKLGGGALSIAVIIHLILAILGGIWIAQRIFEPEKKIDFLPGGGNAGGGERSAQSKVQQKKRAQITPSTSVKRVFAEGAASTFSIPDPGDNFGEMSTLSSLASGGMSGGLGGSGSGGGFGSGNGSGNGLGMGGGGMGKLFGMVGEGQRLCGYIYDFTQTRNSTPSQFANQYDSLNNLPWLSQEVTKFVEGGWKESNLARYFRGPEKLFIHQFLIPQSVDNTAPKAFGAEGKMKGSAWIAVYRGSVCAPESGEIRFWGMADNYLAVRFNYSNVLTYSCGKRPAPTSSVPGLRNPFATGEWIRIQKGRWYDMNVLIGDAGGLFSAALLFERKGAEGKYCLFRTEATDNQEILDQDKGDLPKVFESNSPVWGCRPGISF